MDRVRMGAHDAPGGAASGLQPPRQCPVSPMRDQGFSHVRAAFAALSAKQPAGGAALSVTLDGDHVLELVAGDASHGQPWQHDTRPVLMSVSKGMAGVVAAMLLDRGLLSVDEPVARYWPEFAANGKHGVTVRMVLMHTSGVLGLQ